jgi:hypothetical protein
MGLARTDTRKRTMKDKVLKEIKDELDTLVASCREGEDGSWNASKNLDGFDAMANSCYRIADLLGIELKDE